MEAIEQQIKDLTQRQQKIGELIEEVEISMKPYEGKGFDDTLLDDEGYPTRDLTLEQVADYREKRKRLNGNIIRTYY